MSNWIEQLRGFSSAIRSGAGAPAGMGGGTGYSLERGMEVYRNNYRGNLHDALAGAYPVLRQLVGEAFFRRLARSFIEQHPSRSGNLHDYGGEMSRFLQQFEPVQHLPYLPDMASLEWAWHRAYLAEDVPAFDVQRLSSLAPDSYAHLRWQLPAGSALLASDYPLSLVWQAHQPGEPDRVLHRPGQRRRAAAGVAQSDGGGDSPSGRGGVSLALRTAARAGHGRGDRGHARRA